MIHKFSQVEINQSVRLRESVEAKIAKLRKMNDKFSNNDLDTAFLRGQIQTLKDLLVDMKSVPNTPLHK